MAWPFKAFTHTERWLARIDTVIIYTRCKYLSPAREVGGFFRLGPVKANLCFGRPVFYGNADEKCPEMIVRL